MSSKQDLEERLAELAEIVSDFYKYAATPE